jgi:hypothetical protein
MEDQDKQLPELFESGQKESAQGNIVEGSKNGSIRSSVEGADLKPLKQDQ